MTNPDYELVATQASYYSAKVRACLQYKRIPYTEIGCNFHTILERVIPATGDHFFPVVFCPNGEILKDSCDIVEALERLHPNRPVMPEDPELSIIASFLELVADELFAIPMIYYRWVPEDTREWALQLFKTLPAIGVKKPEYLQLAEDMSLEIANGVQDRIKKVGQDREEIHQASIKITEKFCDLLDAHLKETPFMLGGRPCLADLGLMNGMFGHLYHDPCDASNYIRRHCLHLARWIENMHSAAGISDQGELYLADTMKDVLRYLTSVFGHMALETLNAGNERLPKVEADTGEPVKPGIAKIETFLDDVPLTRPATTYVAWRLQRVIDIYQAIPEAQKSSTDELLEDIGLKSICQFQVNWRMEKKEYKLYLTSY